MAEPAVAVRGFRPLVWVVRFGMVLAGLAAGLVVAETVFKHRDGGAFPHVNFYVADAKLGVRLEPNATEKISFGGNPITTLHTNKAGYRGADWPAPTVDEILVVGDSQVFGLGVEDNQTFSAKLAVASRRQVINAGVPTYGPAEYKAIIEEQLAARHMKTVVLTLNLVNDLFELSHPNLERHAVWDGWAVRKENAPTSASSFPGRRWLMSQSHLVFAWRKWRHKGDPVAETGVASEGTWRDIVVAGESIAAQKTAQDAKVQAQYQGRRDALKLLTAADHTIDETIDSSYDIPVSRNEGFVGHAINANTGDIVEDSYGEESRSTVVTAELVRQAVIQRNKLRKEAAAWAAAHPKNKTAATITAAMSDHDKAMEALAAMAPEELDKALEPPLGAYIREVNELCQKNGAKLVVLVLPIDVQVNASEWAKYDAKPQDMSATTILGEELVAVAASAGAAGLDATATLAAAEPGAFLDHDIHMTAKGHAAVAEALAKVIAAPAAVIAKEKHRTLVPLPEQWRSANETIVSGSTAAGCETKRIGEWFRVLCGRTPNGDLPTEITVVSDPSGESMMLREIGRTSLVTPIEPGRDVTLRFAWTDHTSDLSITWAPEAAKPTIAFGTPVKIAGKKEKLINEYGYYESDSSQARDFPSKTSEAICKCWSEVFLTPSPRSCSGAYGAEDAACVTTYAADCVRMLECTRRDPASPAKN